MNMGRLHVYGYCYAPKIWRFDLNRRDNRLYYIHGGKGGCRYQGRDYSFRKGQLYFIPYHRDLELYSDEKDPILHTYADFELIPPVICDRVLSADPSGDPMFSAAVELFLLGGRAQNMTQKGEDNEYPSVGANRLCMSAMLYLIDRLTEIHCVPVISDEVILAALTKIHNGLSENLSVSALASDAYMNCDSFIRRFSRVLGMTPYAYIKQLRLRTAYYLRETGMPLSEIALETGYADSSSLLHALNQSKENQ